MAYTARGRPRICFCRHRTKRQYAPDQDVFPLWSNGGVESDLSSVIPGFPSSSVYHARVMDACVVALRNQRDVVPDDTQNQHRGGEGDSRIVTKGCSFSDIQYEAWGHSLIWLNQLDARLRLPGSSSRDFERTVSGRNRRIGLHARRRESTLPAAGIEIIVSRIQSRRTARQLPASIGIKPCLEDRPTATDSVQSPCNAMSMVCAGRDDIGVQCVTRVGRRAPISCGGESNNPIARLVPRNPLLVSRNRRRAARPARRMSRQKEPSIATRKSIPLRTALPQLESRNRFWELIFAMRGSGPPTLNRQSSQKSTGPRGD